MQVRFLPTVMFSLIKLTMIQKYGCIPYSKLAVMYTSNII